MATTVETVATPKRNGLEILAACGVPAAAITSMLILLAVLTVLPHVGGRDFGPYSLPMLVRISSFWLLSLGTPLLWVLLFTRAFPMRAGFQTNLWRRLLFLEIVAVILSVLTSPVIKEASMTFDLGPATPSDVLSVDVPFGQHLEASVEGATVPAHLHVYLCGASDKDEDCVQAQRADSSSVRRWSEPGKARAWIFNYENNPKIQGILRIRYIARRAI